MKKKSSAFIGKVLILLAIVLAVFSGGYFFIDKLIVPKYFGKYGIHNVPDLVGVVTSLYNSPKESKLIKNGYTQSDVTLAIKALQDANYAIADDGTIDKNVEFKGDKSVTLSDREFAGICNKLIESGILVDALPNLNYINLEKISILEVTTTPDEDSKVGDDYMGANISFIAKIDTVDIRDQIAEQMDTPIYLLKMIIPDTLYFSVSYDLDLTKQQSERVSNGKIAINGRSEEQSKILIDLLVEFIFPEEENMNKDKLTADFGNIILEGIDALGDFKFVKDVQRSNQKLNGLKVTPHN